MAAKRIKSARVRDLLGQIMDEVYYKGNDYIVERGNKPMAVIISVDEYKRIQKERENDFEILDEILESNTGFSPGEMEKDICETITELRKGKKHDKSRS